MQNAEVQYQIKNHTLFYEIVLPCNSFSVTSHDNTITTTLDNHTTCSPFPMPESSLPEMKQ